MQLPVHVTRPGPPGAAEEGEPVLLLHGFPGSWRSFDAVVGGLVAAGRRVLVPEQRGYTASARPGAVEAYRLDRLVADAVAVLDAAGAQRATVVGHDWGAVVAWALGASHPERVGSLVALSVPHPRAFGAGLAHDREQRLRSAYIGLLRRRGLAERVLLAGRARGLRAAFAGSAVPRDVVDAHLAPLSSPETLAGALAWYRALRSRDLAAVGAVTVPTTYLWSDRDVAVARGTAARCAAHVTGPYRGRTLRGVSHWVPEDAPDAVVDAVLHPPAP
ncbi:alpha/beta hydrolase [uncultured Pseudokineococcus sp.]|uniref:alpha/beta fold hydrolase n=1 Tax=uncultured Pseudokineococcus sp. TaxID=1642928 RepID=UPI0034186C77